AARRGGLGLRPQRRPGGRRGAAGVRRRRGGPRDLRRRLRPDRRPLHRRLTMPGPSADHATAEAWRREQRAVLIARRAALSDTAFRDLSKAVVEQVGKALADLWSRRIGLYWPHRREVGLF